MLAGLLGGMHTRRWSSRKRCIHLPALTAAHRSLSTGTRRENTAAITATFWTGLATSGKTNDRASRKLPQYTVIYCVILLCKSSKNYFAECRCDRVDILNSIIFSKRNANCSFCKYTIKVNCLENMGYLRTCTIAGRAGRYTNSN